MGLRPKQDVLLLDGSFQFSFLARTLVMTGDNAILLRELHDLRAAPAIGPFRVDRPIASDVGRRLLRYRDIADRHQKKAKKNQFRVVFPHGVIESRILLPDLAGL